MSNNTTPQVLGNDDFYTFGDPAVGNGSTIDFLTPYARIQGSGDGSFDLYGFDVTAAMLDPAALVNTTSDADSTPDTSDFFTSVTLRLQGKVTKNDVWSLGIRYVDYALPAVASDCVGPNDDCLRAIALALASQLPARFHVSIDATLPILTISDSAGFNLRGLTGINQDAYAAATVTRTSKALTTAAVDTPITFTSADVTFSGTPVDKEIWSITVADHAYACTVNVSPCTMGVDRLTSVASYIAGLINATTGFTASSAGGKVSIGLEAATGFTLESSIAGVNPQGSALIEGTPAAADASATVWTTAQVALPGTVRTADRWTITLTNADGTGTPVTASIVPGTTSGATLADPSTRRSRWTASASTCSRGRRRSRS